MPLRLEGLREGPTGVRHEGLREGSMEMKYKELREGLREAVTAVVSGGGEGIVLRAFQSPYINGRSSFLLKLKVNYWVTVVA